ncbi:YciI family protein [Micromonospora sp. WMMD1102]|uniref:YciI family protein n=1 Tax=Micromonospora sp. WMMD1102 TaxID=3016105 RepID=UPI00241515EC|nr:YciI family protein [Micromonospora sp. WMMD1102]MDG4791173.1 YciI family protein [Micromonospora sp. WMMD1102]
MAEYLITFNDEWVPEHTAEQLRAKGVAGWAVVEEMRTEDVLIFSNGALDRSTAICSVESVDGEPVFTDGPYVETKEHLGGFAVVDVPDDETARYWAGRLATALDWPQEVHRFPGRGEARRNGSAQR